MISQLFKITLYLSFIVCSLSIATNNEVFPDYIVVVDAGSSGSRANLFHLIRDSAGVTTEVKQMGQFPTTPGISSFESHPEDAWDSLYPILRLCENEIDPNSILNTPVYIFATAGMRVLSKSSQKRIYHNIYTHYLKSDIKLYIDESMLKTIDGEEEAVYGWITVNILKHRITPSMTLQSNEKTVAAIDLGGESTQISFKLPDPHEKAGDPINIQKDIHKKSYLFFGAKEALNRYELYIANIYKSANHTIPSPCFNKNYRGTHPLLEGVTFIGTGNCQQILQYLSKGDSPCQTEKCALWSDPLPDFQGEYVGMSMYFFSLDSLHVYLPAFPFPVTTIKDIYQYSNQFCSMENKDVYEQFGDKHKYTAKDTIHQRCFHLSWIYTLLHSGYHLSDDAKIYVGKDIDNTPIDWSFGAAVYMGNNSIPYHSSHYLILSIVVIVLIIFTVFMCRRNKVSYVPIKKSLLD
ncbi:hypothetical protein WA158_002053 [Blastocystis sp. Blastoise]